MTAGVSRATGRHQRGRDEYPRHGGRGRQDKPDLGGSIGQQRKRRRGSVADPLARPDHVGREGAPCHEASNGCAPDGGERVWAPPRTGQGAVPPANPTGTSSPTHRRYAIEAIEVTAAEPERPPKPRTASVAQENLARRCSPPVTNDRSTLLSGGYSRGVETS